MNKKQIQRIERALAILRKVDEEMCDLSNQNKLPQDDRSRLNYLYAAIRRLEEDVLPLKSED